MQVDSRVLNENNSVLHSAEIARGHKALLGLLGTENRLLYVQGI